MSRDRRKALVTSEYSRLSVVRQCKLVGISRSSHYYTAQGESDFNLSLMRRIDRQYLKTPWYGSRQMARHLRREGLCEASRRSVGRTRVRRLMRLLGLQAIYQKPRTSIPNQQHRVYPYLLRDLVIERPNQVWSADITYIPMSRGFLYLVAVTDWHSRAVLSWRLSNTLDSGFCVEALTEALARYGPPEIFNTDQGSQFTSEAFTEALADAGVRISMDGKGRWMDNVFIERLWRSLKYECVYLREFATGHDAHREIGCWLEYYNTERPHSALVDKTPMEAYLGTKAA